MYLLFMGLIVSLQRKLIYHPSPEPVAVAGDAAGRIGDVEVTTGDGLTLRGWLVRAADGSDPQRPLILYCPGNAAHRGHRARTFTLLSDLGCDVLIVDYRGYGGNPGSPSEAGLMQDAEAVWDYATGTLQTPPERIIVFGESLGGGVATCLASRCCRAEAPPRGLIIQSSFTSLADAGSHHFRWLPVSWLLLDRYPSIDRMPHVTCPVLVYHGDRDEVVPYALGQKLFEAAPEKSVTGVAKRFVTLTGTGHNDVMHVAAGQVREAVRTFLQDIAATK